MTNAEIDELVCQQDEETRRMVPRQFQVGDRVRMVDRGKRIWPDLPAEGVVTDVLPPRRKGQWQFVAVHGKHWHAGWWMAVTG